MLYVFAVSLYDTNTYISLKNKEELLTVRMHLRIFKPSLLFYDLFAKARPEYRV